MSTAAVIVVGAGAVVVGGAAVIAARGQVNHLEHAAGVHPALRALLGAWNSSGPHRVVISPADTDWSPTGGVRTDEASQAAAAGAGLSNASALRDTPHGRAAALDVWPEGFNPHRGFDAQPGMLPLFNVFGEWAESQRVVFGGALFEFSWGGRWSKPDRPHVEIRGWQQLPFPPPDYGEGFV